VSLAIKDDDLRRISKDYAITEQNGKFDFSEFWQLYLFALAKVRRVSKGGSGRN